MKEFFKGFEKRSEWKSNLVRGGLGAVPGALAGGILGSGVGTLGSDLGNEESGSNKGVIIGSLVGGALGAAAGIGLGGYKPFRGASKPSATKPLASKPLAAAPAKKNIPYSELRSDVTNFYKNIDKNITMREFFQRASKIAPDMKFLDFMLMDTSNGYVSPKMEKALRDMYRGTPVENLLMKDATRILPSQMLNTKLSEVMKMGGKAVGI